MRNVYGGILKGSVGASRIRNRKTHLGYGTIVYISFWYVCLYVPVFVVDGVPACQFCIGMVDNGVVCLCVDSKCLFRFSVVLQSWTNWLLL